MSRIYDKAITIQKINEITEDWEDVFKVHARINRAKSDSEYVDAGATRQKRSITFEIRYFKQLEDIDFNIRSYRILYNNVPYDITDYDDFMFSHKTVKLLGVSY